MLGARGNELIPAPLLEIQTRRPRASWLAQTADRIPQAIQAHAPRLRVRVAVDGAARSRAARYPSLTKENIGLRRAIFGATFFFFPCSRGSVVPGRVARLLNNALLRFFKAALLVNASTSAVSPTGRPLGASAHWVQALGASVHWAQACCSRAEWAKRVGRTNLYQAGRLENSCAEGYLGRHRRVVSGLIRKGKFGGIDWFDSMLEEQVGYMDATALRGMCAEHCMHAASSTAPFSPPNNPGLVCMPKGEFFFVVGKDIAKWEVKPGARPAKYDGCSLRCPSRHVRRTADPKLVASQSNCD